MVMYGMMAVVAAFMISAVNAKSILMVGNPQHLHVAWLLALRADV